mmetsp:Transcript_5226/g.6191  ORF Transcript_5226/g.6191 Transcript_5226/m.6191 type:complete len:124 (+) Transcript_5226:1297-1668(+)
MIIDKSYNIEMLDLMAKLDIIEILQNPVIESIVSDLNRGIHARENFMCKSLAFKALLESVENLGGKQLENVRKLSFITSHQYFDEQSFRKSIEIAKHKKLLKSNSSLNSNQSIMPSNNIALSV